MIRILLNDPNWFKLLRVNNTYINDIVEVKAGTVTGDDNYFLNHWFEIAFNELNLLRSYFIE